MIKYKHKELSENVQDNVLRDVKDYVDNSNPYSTEEVKTGGKWIDGKPIYRKVVTGLGNTYDNWNIILLDANVHADHVIYCNLVRW